MSGNETLILQHYGDGENENKRQNSSHTEWLEFYNVKKIMAEYISKDDRVLEIGCATGEYALYFSDRCKEYLGVDLTPGHIDIFNKRIRENDLNNVSCRVGNAKKLDFIPDDSYDVVCCFGPMYHMPPEERALVFAECNRVCRNGGIVAFTYRNKVGVYVGACVHDKYREIYPKETSFKYIFEKGTEDWRPNLFYFTMPEEIEEEAEKYDFDKLRNSGINFLITSSVVDNMDDREFAVYMEMNNKMIEYNSCAGMSNNAILVCKKKSIQKD